MNGIMKKYIIKIFAQFAWNVQYQRKDDEECLILET